MILVDKEVTASFDLDEKGTEMDERVQNSIIRVPSCRSELIQNLIDGVDRYNRLFPPVFPSPSLNLHP